MTSCIFTPGLRLLRGCVALGLLTGTVGCSDSLREAKHVEVTGQVLFGGKPLPGGKVTFVAVNGGFASMGTIDETGHYRINAPVGAVEIGVTNRMLQPSGGIKGPARLAKTGIKEAQRQKGQWVQIPSSYEDPHTSGLKYTVKPGAQTHDIELSADSRLAPGQAGSP